MVGNGTYGQVYKVRLQWCRSVTVFHGTLLGVYSSQEIGGVMGDCRGRGPGKEKREEESNEGRKQQGVGCFCWLLPEFRIIGVAGTGLELNGVWERNS